MALPKICGVCRSGFRGSYAIHQGTLRHLRAAFRAAHPLGSRKSPRRIARGQSARRVRRIHAADPYGESDVVKIRKHRRSPPDNGRRKVVAVRTYWRRKSWGR